MGLVKFLTTAATTSSSTVGYRGIWPNYRKKTKSFAVIHFEMSDA